MTDRKKSDLTPVGRLVAASLDQGFLGLAREMVRVFEVWEGAVGAYNAGRASPESIQSGVLTVLVDSPSWIDHFGYFKLEFIQKINEALGGPLVKEIKFKVGPRPGSSRPPRAD